MPSSPLVWHCTDIEEQKALEAQSELLLEAERAARSDLERASKMKDEFLATLTMKFALLSTRSSAGPRSCEKQPRRRMLPKDSTSSSATPARSLRSSKIFWT